MALCRRFGEAPAVRSHSEIARKYCHILRKYGPHSPQVRQAALAMSTGAVDSEVLGALDEILQPEVVD